MLKLPELYRNENSIPIENALSKSEEDEELDFPFDYSKTIDEVYNLLQEDIKDMKLRCKFTSPDEKKIFANMVKAAYQFEVNLFVNKRHMCHLPRDKVEDVINKCLFQYLRPLLDAMLSGIKEKQLEKTQGEDNIKCLNNHLFFLVDEIISITHKIVSDDLLDVIVQLTT
ncbi:unnamed protein product [Ambrosiozyma monospora]|uniref:Unnamed protein product n=1 Tax=Ambrosiozyma monospora TaxID=43982 RepID=A0A9W6Z3X4_AMBMO|nr:unnamed protein product [Ambrosiozyma monospora]